MISTVFVPVIRNIFHFDCLIVVINGEQTLMRVAAEFCSGYDLTKHFLMRIVFINEFIAK